MLAAKKGYHDVYVYAEGMPVWEEIGYDIVTGPRYEAKIETTKMPPQILKGLMDSGNSDFIVVDVRDEAEFKEGHIPGAINIPATKFALQSDVLDKKKTIIVYCNAGNRSYMAYRKLMKLDYKKFYQSLFADWKGAGFEIEKG